MNEAKVTRAPEQEVSAISAMLDVPELERAITSIANAMKPLRASRLTDKALYLLLSHASGVPQRDCKKVVDALGDLEKNYLKPRAKS